MTARPAGVAGQVHALGEKVAGLDRRLRAVEVAVAELAATVRTWARALTLAVLAGGLIVAAATLAVTVGTRLWGR